jgi:hypothetical protein
MRSSRVAAAARMRSSWVAAAARMWSNRVAAAARRRAVIIQPTPRRCSPRLLPRRQTVPLARHGHSGRPHRAAGASCSSQQQQQGEARSGRNLQYW